MPKKILYESAVTQFLRAVQGVANAEGEVSAENARRWRDFADSLEFHQAGPRTLGIQCSRPKEDKWEVAFDEAALYTRGDLSPERTKLPGESETSGDDPIEQANLRFFTHLALDAGKRAGLGLSPGNPAAESQAAQRLNGSAAEENEETFHDRWASGESAERIDVRTMNEACCAPEMRYIRSQLGDIRGKTLLDVGAGLGEASVYFAMEGADVTSLDISQSMLDMADQLARRNNVSLTLHKATAEDLGLPAGKKFDIIYSGNLFHHVEIETAVKGLVKHLKPEGTMVSWDPVAYNPVINVYRNMATKVRTPGEHPFTLSDIRIFRRSFGSVRTRWFWLTTLVVFLIMALLQRRDPNKERYWKKVVEESDRWAWIYKPLELVDRVLLTVFPFLGPLCWNVVIVAKEPRDVP